LLEDIRAESGARVNPSDTLNGIEASAVSVPQPTSRERGVALSDWYCEQVLSGKRPIDIAAETDAVLAFHHTRPSYEAAHVVVIPKKHVASLLSDDLNAALLLEMLDVVRAVAADVVRDTRRCRIVTNLGEYQESQHLHWHVISGARIADPIEVVSSTARPLAQAFC
jgi:histidine triad (HIT) family protein